MSKFIWVIYDINTFEICWVEYSEEECIKCFEEHWKDLPVTWLAFNLGSYLEESKFAKGLAEIKRKEMYK